MASRLPTPSPTPAAPAGRYTRTAIMLHWVIAVLIIGNVALGWLVNLAPDGVVRPMIDTHKSVGITVFGLALLRLLWRAGHRPPPLPARYPRLERVSAHAAHWALYALMLALPLSGWLHDSAFGQAAAHPLKLFWLVPVPRLHSLTALPQPRRDQAHAVLFAWHVWLGYALDALVLLHIGGALKHQLADHEPELQRMLP